MLLSIVGIDAAVAGLATRAHAAVFNFYANQIFTGSGTSPYTPIDFRFSDLSINVVQLTISAAAAGINTYVTDLGFNVNPLITLTLGNSRTITPVHLVA